MRPIARFRIATRVVVVVACLCLPLVFAGAAAAALSAPALPSSPFDMDMIGWDEGGDLGCLLESDRGDVDARIEQRLRVVEEAFDPRMGARPLKQLATPPLHLCQSPAHQLRSRLSLSLARTSLVSDKAGFCPRPTTARTTAHTRPRPRKSPRGAAASAPGWWPPPGSSRSNSTGNSTAAGQRR